MTKELPPNTPEGARLLCEQADIEAIAEQFFDFDGIDLMGVAVSVRNQLVGLLPLYDRNRRSTISALSLGRGNCGHRSTAIEAVFSQIPNTLSALVIKPGHMFNVVASETTRQVVVLENDLHTDSTKDRDSDEEVSIEYGDVFTIALNETREEELKFNGDLLLSMMDTGDSSRAYDITSVKGKNVYLPLQKLEKAPCSKVLQLAGMSALKFINTHYS